MEVSSSRFGSISVQFKISGLNRRTVLLGFSSSPGHRHSLEILGRRWNPTVRLQSCGAKCELNVHKEAVDPVVPIPESVEHVSSSDEIVVKHGCHEFQNNGSVEIDDRRGGGFFGDDSNSGGGGGGGGDDNGGEFEKGDDREFGPILKFDEVMREVEARGATLPSDMLEAAKSIGIRSVILSKFLDHQGSVWPLGAAIRSCGMLRNRMLADPAFLFKVVTEIVIDSSCATLAEVQKRGKDFWKEFDLYLADLLVGIAVDIALVGMLAPYTRFGRPSVAKGFLGSIQRTCEALPSSVFESERPGCRFSVNQRIRTYFYKGVMYGSVGFVCGLIGQGIANLIMTAKRQIKTSDSDVPVPPLVKSAALWGVFLAVSSNTRYQIVNGLESIVEGSALARQVPAVALAFTVGVRFANNIYASMQFVDWARWSGCQ